MILWELWHDDGDDDDDDDDEYIITIIIVMMNGLCARSDFWFCVLTL